MPEKDYWPITCLLEHELTCNNALLEPAYLGGFAEGFYRFQQRLGKVNDGLFRVTLF
jgi:hypothetical protein